MHGDHFMKSLFVKVAIIVMSIALVGCSSNTQRENTTIGAVTGAVAGGLVGSTIGGGTGKLIAVGVGALAGALLGGEIGKNMQSTDNDNMSQALSNNPSGKTSTWKNQKTGARYSMTPTKMMVVNGNKNCRQYQARVSMNGKLQVVNGVACLDQNGKWQTVATN